MTGVFAQHVYILRPVLDLFNTASHVSLQQPVYLLSNTEYPPVYQYSLYLQRHMKEKITTTIYSSALGDPHHIYRSLGSHVDRYLIPTTVV